MQTFARKEIDDSGGVTDSRYLSGSHPEAQWEGQRFFINWLQGLGFRLWTN